MTEAARTTSGTYTQIRIREPLGERIVGETLTIGGPGADVVVPGADATVLRILRQGGAWVAVPVSGTARFDGRSIEGPTELRRHDVIAVAQSQVIVTAISRTLLRLDVCHLQGNSTVAPAGTLTPVVLHDDDDDEIEVVAPLVPAPVDFAAASGLARLWARSRTTVAALGIALVVVLSILIGVWAQLVPVSLDIEPANARVQAPGARIAMRIGTRLFLWPGAQVIRAESDGYRPARVHVMLRRHVPASVRLRLAKLPGVLDVDTGGIAGSISVDGARAGGIPGAIQVPPGPHTVVLRAPKHVDFITTLQIEGAGKHQRLRATLQPSWGTFQITTLPPGASVSVDGAEVGITPLIVESPSGVRRLRIVSEGHKPWESSVVLDAGESLTVGPITLGQPDAHISVRSRPAVADVMIGGEYRGHTPLDLDLPAGVQQEVMLNAAGYAPWMRQILPVAGKALTISAALVLVGARVSVQGEPADAELLIDGVSRGRTPQTLILSTSEHQLEVRKPGWLSFFANVLPAAGLDRILRYQLISAQLAASRAQRASVIYTQSGYRLQLLAPMGAGEGEAGHAVYLGATPVSNELFRKFHPDHRSGTDAARAQEEPDDEPVKRVTWRETVEFCNWLSRQDSLPAAYAKDADHYVLRQPVTIGYRLPTPGEWEFAARRSAAARGSGFQGLSGKRAEWLNEDADGTNPTYGFRVARNAE